MSICQDMNDVRDIIIAWEKGFDTEEEKMFFYLKYEKVLREDYWDYMPKGGAIKPHPWDEE